MGDREMCLCQTGQHFRLPAGSMRALQHMPRRIAAQHMATICRCQLSGWIGLAAFEPLDLHRPGKALGMAMYPFRERSFIESKAMTHKHRAEIGVS